MNGPTLTERRALWVAITTSAAPWLADEVAALQDAGGLVFRLSGNESRDGHVLVLDAGSSSLHIALFAADGERVADRDAAELA